MTLAPVNRLITWMTPAPENRLIPWIGRSRVRTIIAFALIGSAIMVLVICSGISQVGHEKKENDAQKAEAGADKPLDEQRQDAGAAEIPGKWRPIAGGRRRDPQIQNAGAAKIMPEDHKNDNQPLLPKVLAKEPFEIIRRIEMKGSLLGISADFKVYAESVVPVNTFKAQFETPIIKIVELETGKELPAPKWDQNWGYPHAAIFSQAAIAIAAAWSGSNPKAVRLFSRRTGELEQHFQARIGHAIGKMVAFTADGRFMAYTEMLKFPSDYNLVLRDMQKKMTVDELHLGASRFLTISGKPTIVCESYEKNDRQVFAVEIEAGKLMKKRRFENYQKMKGLGKDTILHALSPTSDLVACTITDNDDIILYDVVKQTIAHKLEGHLDTVQAVAFSPKGDIVASAAKDKTIRFWAVNDGKEIHVIRDFPSGATGLTFPKLGFSADGSRIIVDLGGGLTLIRGRDD